jgi:hypothetical protein
MLNNHTSIFTLAFFDAKLTIQEFVNEKPEMKKEW